MNLHKRLIGLYTLEMEESRKRLHIRRASSIQEMPVGYQHENNGIKSRPVLHNNHHNQYNQYLHNKAVIVATVISALIFLSSLAVINTTRADFIAYAQLAN